MEKGRNCSSGAIFPLILNILLPDVRIDVKQGSDFLFEISGVEITRVDCNYIFTKINATDERFLISHLRYITCAITDAFGLIERNAAAEESR